MSDKLQNVRVSVGKFGGMGNNMVRLDFYFEKTEDLHYIFPADAEKYEVINALLSLAEAMQK